jgi:hypothetical protein
MPATPKLRGILETLETRIDELSREKDKGGCDELEQNLEMAKDLIESVEEHTSIIAKAYEESRDKGKYLLRQLGQLGLVDTSQ